MLLFLSGCWTGDSKPAVPQAQTSVDAEVHGDSEKTINTGSSGSINAESTGTINSEPTGNTGSSAKPGSSAGASGAASGTGEACMPDDPVQNEKTGPSAEEAGLSADTVDLLEVHFIDVGQADSILVIAPGRKSMLIDGGNTADGDLVTSYIKEQGIGRLDIVIGTHPHEDHIGGLGTVIRAFDIGRIYTPNAANTIGAFKDMLLALQDKGLTVTVPAAGDTFDLGGARCTVLAPNGSNYRNLNNYSIVLKLEYGSTSFLFTGDAEALSEKEMLEKNYDLKADVLKVAHHGSTSSTSPAFLKAVSPKYAVISVGKDNQFGEPDSIILNRLDIYGAEIYRTDESGTVIVISDGKTLTFDKSAEQPDENALPPDGDSSLQSASQPDDTVYITKTGNKYHRDGCRYLSESKIPISLEEAISSGYTPCNVCKPPI